MATLHTILDELRSAVGRMYEILARENEVAQANYWHRVLGELDAMVDPDPRAVEDVARSISNAIGVGPGSLRDVFVADDFGGAVDQVGRLCWQAETAARALGPGSLRRRLTSLETILLESGRVDDAAKLRTLLEQDDVDPDDVDAVLDQVASGGDAATLGPAIEAIRIALAETRNP